MTSPIATPAGPVPDRAFERLLEPHRAALHAHCYRMLGSVADAEDAEQETLLRAWRALPGFEGRSSLRSWLYRIATNVCLRAIERRPPRILATERGAAGDPYRALAAPLAETTWIEPYALTDAAASPADRYEQRESVELAFVAALQHLPARQRAVLLLREVLGFSPAEIAVALDATPTAVYSALQRARAAVAEKRPERSQQATLRALGDAKVRAVAERYATAWEAGDVPAIVALLTEDATFAMPPLPTWFRGRADIGTFLAAVGIGCAPSPTVLPITAAGQLGFAFFTREGAAHAIEVLTLDDAGRIADVTTFLGADLFAHFGLPLAR